MAGSVCRLRRRPPRGRMLDMLVPEMSRGGATIDPSVNVACLNLRQRGDGRNLRLLQGFTVSASQWCASHCRTN
jgi:hypothetical protein